MTNTDTRPQWSSHISFIIAMVGSAVGLGNIWRFPYIMGKNGGAIFLFTYLILIAIICVIPLSCELLIGKEKKKDVVQSYNSINPKLKFFAWLCPATALIIPCFYFVVGGWILNYIWIFLTNNIPSNFANYFTLYSAQSTTPCVFTILFTLFCIYYSYKGVKDGIEKANNIMMPLFVVMLIGLAIFALNLDGAKEGLEFMFKPDFSLFNKETIITALGQALFTLSIGMGTILTYGSYLNKDTNIIKSSYTLIFFDTIIAILAGIMIFPIVFSYNVEPTAGATLIFVSMPEIFSKLPCPILIGTSFFILLLFAAITSGISMLETTILTLIENFKISRKKAAIICASFISLVGILATLSFGVLSDYKIFNKTFFDLLDYATSNVLMPLNALVVCIIVGWLMNKAYLDCFKNKIVGFVFNFLLKFAAPLFILIVLISGL